MQVVMSFCIFLSVSFLLACFYPLYAVGCTTGVVRLVGGSNVNQGRVEICVNNSWGTVCDDHFGINDARVICGQLGYPSVAAYYHSAHFGAGRGPIWLDNLGCSGSEFSLLQCSHAGTGVHNCGHSEDVSVSCSGAKKRNCVNGDVRLADSHDSFSGRVEVCANNFWGTVCDDYWGSNDAKVVCRILHLSDNGVVAYFGTGSGSIILDNLHCTGNEVSLFSCPHNGIKKHNCVHQEDAGVVCGSGCTTGVVRLVGGSAEYQGRVEICVNNTWGTVCDDIFDINDAQVVCHQLGYLSAAAYYSSAHFGAGSGPIWLDNLKCSGTEFSLLQCSHIGIGVHNCVHSEDVSVKCSGTKTGNCVNSDIQLVGGYNISSGRVEVCANNTWGTICNDYWDNSDAKVVCQMLNFHSNGFAAGVTHFGSGSGSIILDNLHCTGNEISLFSCPHNGIGKHNCGHHKDAGVVCGSGCTTGVVRLVGGNTEYQGRVEICVNNIWGTVCDDLFDINDAQVICRQLGFPLGAASHSSANFRAGSGPIWLDNLGCSGSEFSLLQCSHAGKGVHNCGHLEDVTVRCLVKTGNCVNSDIHLVGGHNISSGRVEVCVNNTWGTVCDDSWDNNDAKVVCRMLNFHNPDSKGVAVHAAYFGRGSGPIVLDNLHCTGNEASLFSCTHNGIGTHNCGHHEDAGVVCVSGVCKYGSMRLVGGSYSMLGGRVEICINNQWGTVCDDYWDNNDAKVVCCQLYPFLLMNPTVASFGPGTGPIHLDNVHCSGSENSLLDCNHNGIGKHNCAHYEDAGVNCQCINCGISFKWWGGWGCNRKIF